jgi:alpha-galactosidase/6-phospho-beta-glucosidase family protein
MKVVFVGGGSFRTLPIVRAAMAGDNIFRNGEIVLVDFNLERAETVGKLIMKTPEYAGSDCEIKWTDNLDKALPGTDVVIISFPVGSAKTYMLSTEACAKYGFIGTDQLSLTGAFLSVTGGTIILDIARRMEKHCPDAWLIDHANPVAVYSGMVNNHTCIKALGMCPSCYHPRWDLTRLLFDKDEYRDDYKIASAGVNHFAFLLRGSYKGQDIYKMLDKKYENRPWHPKLTTFSGTSRKMLFFGFDIFQEMYKRFGFITSSNEFDGPKHLFIFHEKLFTFLKHKPMSMADINRQVKKLTEDRKKADMDFRSYVDRELNADFWAQSFVKDKRFGADNYHPITTVLKALGTGKPQWLAASTLNRGAIKGFKERTVVEYSFNFDRKGIHPDPDLEIPDCFHGIVSSLASHQTLLGDAIAMRDPKIFANALFAYPIPQNTKQTKNLWRELLKIHGSEMPKEFQKAKDYF